MFNTNYEEIMYTVFAQPEAPRYFNNSIRALQNILAPLDKLDALVGSVNRMTTLQHVQSETTQAKDIANNAKLENEVLSNEFL